MADVLPDAVEPVRIGSSGDLAERGDALRFPVGISHGKAMAFAIRFDGKVYGYLNRCAHVPVEMDWEPGRFFDLTGLYLICATHGAIFLPDSGLCVDGPCRGARRLRLDLFERDGSIFWRPDSVVHALSPAPFSEIRFQSHF